MSSKIKSFHRIIISISIFLTILIVGFLIWLYGQSQILKNQADRLLQQQQPLEAVNFYKKAQQVFPFRWDIAGAITGANLIAASKKDFDNITEFDEIQIPPPLANLYQIQLNPNELFVPILMYHHIEVNPRPYDTIYAALFVSPQQLDSQLSYFANYGFHAITLDDLANALDGKIRLPSKPIVLTFDDGYQSFYDNAFPLLKKYHMKATEFVITQVETAPAYLSWQEIMALDTSGLVEIGAHTRDHPNLPDLSQAAIIDEIKGSKTDIESHLGHKISWFAYPYGSYSPFILDAVKDAGFRGAAATIYGTGQSKENLYLLRRILIDGRFSLSNIAQRITE